MLKEIFKNQIYRIKGSLKEPYVLDCGANIGLAAIYICGLFKDAKVVCFEPDKKVLKALAYNLDSFGLNKNVTIVEKGLWKDDGVLEFFSEGADGGRLKTNQDNENLIKIDVTKLSSYIDRKVDFLKIDIEGAEFEVLKEIESKLHLVDRIFLEYHSFLNQDQCLAEILQILKNAGFRVNINAPGLSSNSPFFHINSYNGMDMQLNIYAQKY